MSLSARGLVAASVVLAVSSARADDKSDCIAASEQAQTLAAQHHFLAARKQFVACARAECPGPIVKDCSEQLAHVEASIATIVLTARAGRDELRAVRVTIDGAPLAPSLDGRAQSVDPGPHRFVFTDSQGVPRVVDTIVEEGAKLKRIEATFPEPTTPVIPMKRAPVSAFTWVLGGFGLAAVATGTGLGVDTLVRKDRVFSTSALNAFEIEQHVVDIALGVGVVALATAVVMVLARPRVPVTHGTLEGLRLEF